MFMSIYGFYPLQTHPQLTSGKDYAQKYPEDTDGKHVIQACGRQQQDVYAFVGAQASGSELEKRGHDDRGSHRA